MSEAPEKDSKTEEATPQKLDKAREKGDIPKTMDAGQVATLAAVSAVVLMAGGWLSRNLAVQLMPFLSRPDAISLDGNGGVEVFRYSVMAAAPILGAVLAAAAIAGAGANLMQTGLHFTPDKLKMEFSKVSPKKGFERLFGPDGLMQFAKSTVKVIIIGVLVWWILKPYIPQ